MLPQDLKNYRAERDAFDLEFSPDQIIFALIIVIALGAILSQFQ